MPWKLKEAAIAVGDSKIDYAVFGKGSRPLVIIPGLTVRDVKGAGTGLALMYRCFARDYRVYVLDKKADISPGCTVADLADDTASAMQALGLSDACVFGVSLGGMIAEELAIRYPALVGNLVLGVTASRTNETLDAVVERWIDLIERDDFTTFTRDMLACMYSEKYIRRYRWLLPLLSRLSRPKNKERFLRLARAALTADSYGRLGEIGCRTLVLGGEEDKVVTAAASREIADALGCECYLYPGLGHAAYEEASDFNRRIQQFFAQGYEHDKP